ncbi:MAG: TlpA family protein disulfide reductase [Flavobacteriales bacterium]|jgi:thiol-disulfide isomerase/thioredoxin|nr:TlpA family protein disulfide reductase [Flavobacteriales bacterium]MBT6013254.1 TlpA family protein disulfide reductase [Flavobacteriales bacterium]MBT7481952.1 TlpA family protein disulfide reductase [Flavobacteriales bacterium]
MKKIVISICMSILITASLVAQDRTLPNIKVKTLSGKSINIQSVENDGNPIVISFWATWCKPCKKELNTIAEIYEEWQDETGVKLVAVSIDDARSMSKVAPYVNSADWDYEVYLDPNRELARSLNVSTVPHTFLLNGKGKIVWEHKGYIDGDEEELYEQIEKISK